MLSYSTGARNGILDAGFDALFNNGFVDVYAAARPANADAAVGVAVLLASFPLGADAFAAAVAGVKAKVAALAAAAAGAGVAVWFRMRTAGDAGAASAVLARVDGDVTLPIGVGGIVAGTVGEMTLDNTNVQAGQQITVNALTVTMPATYP